jgi:hypothetical protein
MIAPRCVVAHSTPKRSLEDIPLVKRWSGRGLANTACFYLSMHFSLFFVYGHSHVQLSSFHLHMSECYFDSIQIRLLGLILFIRFGTLGLGMA